MTKKPVPSPLALASPKMSCRTDMVVVPLAPAPCVTRRFGVAIVRLALPLAEAVPSMPANTALPVPLAIFNVVIANVRGCEALGVSSMRPPPLRTLKVVMVSVVAAELAPLSVREPPWRLKAPMTSKPRRLLTLFVPELSSAMVLPLFRLTVVVRLNALPLKASPRSTYFRVPPLTVIAPVEPVAELWADDIVIMPVPIFVRATPLICASLKRMI